MNKKKIILASKSPRRSALLCSIVPGERIVIIVSDIEEQPEPGEDAASFCKRAAERKVVTGWNKYDGERDDVAAVIGADTVIWFDNRIIGQPENQADAVRTLMDLSGKIHEVITGVAVFKTSSASMETIAVHSKVWMRRYDKETVMNYVATGEPMDKAGAYGIQGYGKRLVAKYEGSHSNIVGLPVEELKQILKDVI